MRGGAERPRTTRNVMARMQGPMCGAAGATQLGTPTCSYFKFDINRTQGGSFYIALGDHFLIGPLDKVL